MGFFIILIVFISLLVKLTTVTHFLFVTADKQCGFHRAGGDRRHRSPGVRAEEAPRGRVSETYG